jgi:short-subunit dehydrogenase
MALVRHAFADPSVERVTATTYHTFCMKSAIIIGASSGIGRALAVTLSRDGYRVGVVARRTELLAQLQAELVGPCVIKTIDVSKPEVAMPLLRELIDEFRDVELFVVSAGTGFENDALAWERERDTITLNVLGFAGMINVAVGHLEERGSGHLVGISSIAALRGNARAPAYNASKAFVSNYLQGIRYRFKKSKLSIVVTDVQPGFVDTDMAKGDRLIWVASPQKAAEQIAAAIRGRKEHVYVTKRWRLVAWLLKLVPDVLYSKL